VKDDRPEEPIRNLISNIPFTLTDEDLEDAFPPSYLERGVRYFRNGRVLTADYNAAQSLVSGRVRGSGGRVYQCIVQLQRDDSGELTVVGQCSCPVGYNCKHVAATLLSLGDRSAQRSQPDASSGLPPEVRNWLSHVERAAAGAAYDNPQRLLYLLRCEERFGLKRILVHVVRIRQLAAGGYGKPQDHNISAQSRAGFTTPEDHRIMMLIEAGRGRIAQPEAALHEETSADVLHAVALTGRGHWQAVDGPVLKLAAPVTGKLLWRLEDNTRLHLKLEAERPGLALLPATPPWYLDPETGECGPLETGLGAREAGLLAMAPALTSQSADALGEAVPAPLRTLALPLPARTERRRVASESPTPCLHLQSKDLNADIAGRYGASNRSPAVPQCCPDLRIRPLRDRRSPGQEGDARTRGAEHVVGERA